MAAAVDVRTEPMHVASCIYSKIGSGLEINYLHAKKIVGSWVECARGTFLVHVLFVIARLSVRVAGLERSCHEIMPTYTSKALALSAEAMARFDICNANGSRNLDNPCMPK